MSVNEMTARARKFKDLTGMRFGRLSVLELSPDRTCGKATWICRCDCGNVTKVIGRNLTTGDTKSCGCYRRERDHGNENVKHGGSSKKERLYRIWRGMKQRCNNPNATGFSRYGGRGITVCDEWKNNYSAFREWALSHGYADDLTIDRIDNDKDYFPDNCQWATKAQQVRNRAPYTQPNYNRKLYSIKGITRTAQEWSEEIGISQNAFYKRILKGWSDEQMLQPNRYGKESR